MIGRYLHETGTNLKTGDSWSYITFTSQLFNIYYSLTVVTGTQFMPVDSEQTTVEFLLLPENYKLYLVTFIWWPGNIYCTASQNGAIAHFNPSIYSIEATSKSCLLILSVAVQSSYFC